MGFDHRLATRIRAQYGPWAVVTGASSGIGREFALWLAQAGVSTVLVARREAALNELASQLRTDFDAESRVVVADLSTLAGCDAVTEVAESLDVGLLVAAAGFGTSGDFLAGALDDEIEMLHVNCRATLIHAHQFGRRFAERGRGGMVLFSSILGWQGTPHAAHYAATKAWVQSLAEGMHAELAGTGVDVIAAAPGPTASGFGARAHMRMGQTMPASAVVVPVLTALGRRSTVLPGRLTKLLTWSLKTAPRRVRTRILGRIMGDMTAHQRGK